MENSVTFAEPHAAEAYPARESQASSVSSSGVSWGAVIGGAFVAAALSTILLALGAGLGLSAVSPWSNVGVAASTAGAAAIVWLILIEIVASGLGGYLTGRLRTKWSLIHTDEVYFRDTANGFLAWAVAVVISLAFLASGAAAMVGARLNSTSTLSPTDPNAYFVDQLFRSPRAAVAAGSPVRAQAAGIFLNDLPRNEFPLADQSYLAELVATQTGLNVPEAEQRVMTVIADARSAEDQARKVTSHLLLWTFLALLLGALSASYAATIGGRQRDHVRAA